MGLAAELGYAYPRPNALQRLVQSFAGTRVGAWASPRTLVPLDHVVTRLSRGRVSLPVLLAGLPVLDLTTTGRRSGLPRSTRVIAIPFEETLALLGTNFGRPRTPAWALNLAADPHATVSFDGLVRAVVATPATEEQRAAIESRAAAAFAGAVRYEQLARVRRTVPVFVLAAAGPREPQA